MRVGVSFSIPIEEMLQHVELVLSSRINLQKQADSYDRVSSTLKNNGDPTVDDLVGIVERIAEIRKGLLEVDQALEDSVNILSGYVGFLKETELGPPPEHSVQDPDKEEDTEIE
tara:strand:- start:1336 stop:1677 length:342 start_codon:yes stop_codon:yes gene_type:complete